jgi:aspartyl/asparaginyl beta-hydroxylase (cupin superfamily)
MELSFFTQFAEKSWHQAVGDWELVKFPSPKTRPQNKIEKRKDFDNIKKKWLFWNLLFIGFVYHSVLLLFLD